MSSITEPRAAAPSRVSKSAVEAAVTALLKHKASQSANDKPQLLPQDDYFYLNLTLKKIPSNPRTNPYRIPLPNPIFDAAGTEVCLIVDDRPRTTTPPADQIKKLIKSQSIPISKVIKLSKLRANYKPFEARRKLCDSYNVFLVDKRVVHLLPKLIGKEFFKKKKLPLGVDLGKKNLKLQVERVLGSGLLFIRSGTCSVMKVGKMEMEKGEIVENVVEAIKGAVEKVPKKWDGVRSLHLKFSNSVALPIYQAKPEVRLKIEGLKEVEEGGEVTETSDNDGANSGKKKKKKERGRIHEVRYMDVGEDLDSDLDDIDMIEEVRIVSDELVGKKEVKLVQSSDDEKTKTESEKKKRKVKAQKESSVLGKSKGQKQAKKSAKPEEEEEEEEKEVILGVSDGKKRAKKSSKSEEAKKGGLSLKEVAAEVKGKKKSELGIQSAEKKKKRVSA